MTNNAFNRLGKGRFVDIVNQYEVRKKKELVKLGQSRKPYNEIIAYLKSEIELSTKMSNFDHRIKCFRDDGVYQLNRAIEEIYGASSAKEQRKSGGGVRNIDMITVTLSDGATMKIPYGDIDLPDLGEEACIKIHYDFGSRVLSVRGSCEFRYSSMIDTIIARTRKLLNTDSIYKNQAIEIGNDFQPQILDLSDIDDQYMVLSEATEYEIKPLLSRILHPEKCIEKGIPLKTGVLFEGTYGTGKTLLAFKIARQAVVNGWCFIYLKDPKKLAETLKLSKTLDKNSHGVIVFLEDVDQVTRGNRNASMQDILNTLDGGDTKSMNVISMFTTNHIELIEPTFLRGKRIGSIVSMGYLDATTAKKFIKHSFKGYEFDDEQGLDEVCGLIAEKNIVPAFMAEIVESVKGNMIIADENIVKCAYIKASLNSYLRQAALAQTKDMSMTPENELANALAKVLKTDMLDKNNKAIKEIKDLIL